jgi:hypothetical protein
MATLDSKDSKSTLVDDNERQHREGQRSGTPPPLPTSSTMPEAPSPFSAYFDPNAKTPLTPPITLASPMTTLARDSNSNSNSTSNDNNNSHQLGTPAEAWTSSLSVSLNALASQFAIASQALSTIPALPSPSPSTSISSAGIDPEALAVVRQAQTTLEQELEALKEQVAYILEHGRSSDKEKAREITTMTTTDAVSPHAGLLEGLEGRLQGIEQNIERLDEAIRLEYVNSRRLCKRRICNLLFFVLFSSTFSLCSDFSVLSQARMYPRLRNSVVTSNKMQITPLMMANGKIPQNFPATKGEFEHLTSTYGTNKLRRPPPFNSSR